MAGQWREALHPRDVTGRFADVAALGRLRTDGQIDRAAARKAVGRAAGWRTVDPGDTDFRDREIARWEADSGRKTNWLQRKFIGRMLNRDVHAAISKDTMTIYARDKTVTAEHMHRVAAIIEKLQHQHPATGPVRIFIDPHNKIPGHLIADPYGLTLLGQPVMILSAAMFTKKGPATVRKRSKRFTPASARVDPLEYLITHEWGHATDPTYGDPRDKAAFKLWRDNYLHLSPYGRGMVTEGHAEAFAEWHLTGGATSNRAARAYAKHYGWKRSR